MIMQKLDSGNASIVIKSFLSLLLFGALAGLILTDVGGFFRDGGTGRTDVARVGNETISGPAFASIYQRRLEQSRITPDIALQMGLPNLILQQEIERLVLLQAAHQNGARIDNAFIATQLKKQLDSLQMSGTAQEKLEQVLYQQQLTEKQLVELLRGDFSINVMASAVTTGDMAVPSELAVAAYRHDMEKRNANIIHISTKAIKDTALSDKDIEKYFNEHKENYRTAETRDVEVLIVPQSLFIKNVSINDEQIKEFYEANKHQFVTPETVRLAQIITESKDTASRIFDEKPSDLSGYANDAVQYLDADWYNQAGLPNEIVAQIFKDKKTGLYAPVKTSLGWHVMVVEGFKEPTPRPLSEVKSTIERQLKDDVLDQHLTSISDEIDSMLGNNAPLKEIADKYALKTITISDIAANNIESKLKNAKLADAVLPRVQEAVFMVEAHEASPLMDTPSGDYAIVRVAKVVPSAIPELGSIRAQLAKDAANADTNKNLLALAENLIGKFNPQDTKAFDAAIKEAGLTVETIRAATKGNVEDEFSADVAQLLFSLTPDNALSYATRPDMVTLVRLTGIEQNTATPTKAEETALLDNVRNSMLQEIQQQFTMAWQNKLGVGVNQTLLQNMFSNNAE